MAQFISKATFHNCHKSTPYTKEVVIHDVAPNQVLVKTHYASINPVDIKLHALKFTSSPVHTLRDFSGVVELVGSELAGKYKVGEKVYGSLHTINDKNFIGSYSILEIDNKNVLEPLPEGVNFEQGASLGVVFSTAFEMLQRAAEHVKLNNETRVLVLGGATAVGTFVIELAKKYFEVGTVVATCSPNSADYVKDYGADEVINYRDSHYPNNIVDYVKSNNRFDAVLDTVGGYDAIKVYPEILKPIGEGNAYVTIMGDAGPANTYAKTMINAILNIPRSLFRHFFGKYFGINYHMFFVTKRDFIGAATTFFMTPGVKVPIDSVLPIEDFKQAWDKVDSTRARGKVLVEF